MAKRMLASAGAILAGVAMLAPSAARADQALSATGSLTYSWHGDPARGCAPRACVG